MEPWPVCDRVHPRNFANHKENPSERPATLRRDVTEEKLRFVTRQAIGPPASLTMTARRSKFRPPESGSIEVATRRETSFICIASA
jgi:hypothetical protein